MDSWDDVIVIYLFLCRAQVANVKLLACAGCGSANDGILVNTLNRLTVYHCMVYNTWTIALYFLFYFSYKILFNYKRCNYMSLQQDLVDARKSLSTL